MMTTVGHPDYLTYTSISSYLACSEGSPVPTDHRFVFIRSASAAVFVWRALSAHDGSSSSNLTSRNVSLLTAPQLDTLKVARDVVVHVALSQKPVPTGLVLVTGLSQPVRDTRVWNGTRWNHYR
jgi:hypothetical protein